MMRKCKILVGIITLFLGVLINTQFVYAFDNEIELDDAVVESLDDQYDQNELLLDYFESQVFAMDENIITYSNDFTAKNFSGLELYVYNNLKKMIEDVASGKRSESKLELDVSSFFGNISASDLGIDEIIINRDDNGKNMLDDETKLAYSAYCNNKCNMSKIIQSAIRDCPYEAYWADNKYSYGATPSVAVRNDNDKLVLAPQKWVINIAVSSYYSKDGSYVSVGGALRSYTVDSEKIKGINQAVANAKAIAKDAEIFSDYKKLKYFRDKICDLTNYNFDAISPSYSDGYGDPWQIIYVFDGNPSTNVVCEGYSKAFQYLCELSSFENDIYCISVTGQRNGAHMWNVVHMDDNRNYVVDITNCDSGFTLDKDRFFIACADKGSVSEGFYINEGYYTYYDETKRIYSEDDLSISTVKYVVSDASDDLEDDNTGDTSDEGDEGDTGDKPDKDDDTDTEDEYVKGWKKNEKGWWYQLSDGTYYKDTWMNIEGDWYYFNKSGYMKTGWLLLGDAWYYLDSSGRRVADKWKMVNGSWYHFNKSGTMDTGWLKDNGHTYYLSTNGNMKVGWFKLEGNWYYANKAGEIKTGWLKLDNKWYYMNSNGVMRTGWTKVDNKWYYMNTNGVMRTGWLKADNKWYYMNSNGVMRTGWLKLDNKWYYMSPSGAMRTGWVKVDEKYYYFYSDGSMAINTRISGYYVDSNGVWSKSR